MRSSLTQLKDKEELSNLYQQVKNKDFSLVLNRKDKIRAGKDALSHCLIYLENQDISEAVLPETLEQELVSGNVLPKLFHVSDLVIGLFYGLEAHNIITPKGKITTEFVERGRWMDLILFPHSNVVNGPCYDLPPLIKELMETRVMWGSIFTPFLKEDDKPARLEVPTGGRLDSTEADSLYAMLSSMGKSYHTDIKILSIDFNTFDGITTYTIRTEGSSCHSISIELDLFGSKIKLNHKNTDQGIDYIRKVGSVVKIKSWIPIRYSGSPLSFENEWQFNEHVNSSAIKKLYREHPDYTRIELDKGLHLSSHEMVERFDGVHYRGAVSFESEMQECSLQAHGMPHSEFIEHYCIIKEYNIETILNEFEEFLDSISEEREMDNYFGDSSLTLLNFKMVPHDSLRDKKLATFSQWMVDNKYWIRLETDYDYVMDSGDLGRDINRLRAHGDVHPTLTLNDNWWHIKDTTHFGRRESEEIWIPFIFRGKIKEGEASARSRIEFNRNKGREIQFPPNFTLKQFGEDTPLNLPTQTNPKKIETRGVDYLEGPREQLFRELEGEPDEPVDGYDAIANILVKGIKKLFG